MQLPLTPTLRARAKLLAAAALVLLSVSIAFAQVPYVPTPQNVVDRMLEVAQVGPQDYLIDLGSGDGRIVVTAARKHGARGFGVDLNPTRIAEANANARQANVTDKVQFFQSNLFETDLTPASVITMYLLPKINLDLRPRLLDLKAGTRIVSHDFDMDDWKPDRVQKFLSPEREHVLYLWTVPPR